MKHLNLILLFLFSLMFFGCGENLTRNQSSQVTGLEGLNPNDLSASEKDLLDTVSWCKKENSEYLNSGCIFEEDKMLDFNFENENQSYMTLETLGSTSVNPDDTFILTGENGYQFSVRCGDGYSIENEPTDIEIEQVGESRIFSKYLTDSETGERFEESQFAVAKVSSGELLIVLEDRTVFYESCD